MVAGVSVSGFAPSYGSPGVSVSIRGQGFDPLSAGNVVVIGGIATVADSAQPDLIIAKVPIAAVSGPLSVAVKGIVATSTVDFVVLPAGTVLSGLLGGTPVSLNGAFRSYSSLPGRAEGQRGDA
jgi:hypothetical protein